MTRHAFDHTDKHQVELLRHLLQTKEARVELGKLDAPLLAKMEEFEKMLDTLTTKLVEKQAVASGLMADAISA